MDLSNMDTMQLCEDLANAFNKIVQDNKQILPQFDELIGKGSKFQKDLKATLVSLCSFLDIFQQIADSASATNSSNRNSGTVMTRIVLRQRAFENHLKVISNALEESVLIPLQNKPEEWRKTVNLLERQHSKDLKMMKAGIKQSTDQLTKLSKKSKKDPTQLLYKQQEKIHDELHTKYMTLEAQERNAVRRVNDEEKLHFNSLMKGFKPVIQEQTRMISSLEQLRDVHEEIEGCLEDNSAKDAVEETILRNMKPCMEVLTPTSSLASNKTARRRLERSLSMSSRTSSMESLTETDGFPRTNGAKPQIPTFRHSQVYCNKYSKPIPSHIVKIRRNSISSLFALEELEKGVEDIDCDDSSTPLCNEATINEDDLAQMYSGMSTAIKPLKRNPWLHRSNSFINQCGSPPQRFEIPLTNIEEHHEFMPEPMAPLENTSLPLYAGINQRIDVTGSAPAQRTCNSSVQRTHVTGGSSVQRIDNALASQNSAANNVTQPPPSNIRGRRDIPAVSQPLPINLVDESSRGEDSQNTEQLNKDKDDDSSEGSQDSSSGYGSPGDDCRTNNGTTTPKQFERSNSRRASFSTFSPISPNFARNTNFPTRRHSFRDSDRQNQAEDETLSRGPHRRQSFYAAPPSIPENTNLIPSFSRNDLQVPSNHHQKYPLHMASQQQHQSSQQQHRTPQQQHQASQQQLQASQQQHQASLQQHRASQQQHQASQQQHQTSQQQHQHVKPQQNLGSFTFETQHKNEHSNSHLWANSPSENSHLWANSPSENSHLWPNSPSENSHLWPNSPSEMSPVTNQIEVFPFNNASAKQRCPDKNMYWPANNSLEEADETLPVPPHNQHEEIKHRAGDNNSWDETEQEIQMIYDHFYTSDFNKAG